MMTLYLKNCLKFHCVPLFAGLRPGVELVPDVPDRLLECSWRCLPRCSWQRFRHTDVLEALLPWDVLLSGPAASGEDSVHTRQNRAFSRRLSYRYSFNVPLNSWRPLIPELVETLLRLSGPAASNEDSVHTRQISGLISSQEQSRCSGCSTRLNRIWGQWKHFQDGWLIWNILSYLNVLGISLFFHS